MRKCIVSIILLFAILLIQTCSFNLQAQNPVKTDTSITTTGPRSFAMILGISNYKNIRPLSFADSDASLFREFLKSADAGSFPDDHILYLVNEDATAANFWVKGMSWLRQKKLQAGDKLFIYLAGHGDAINQDEYFFLTYDCNPAGDKNNYIVTGSIQLYNLKSRIAELSRKNVDVYLIMDACRTNELPGGADGQEILNNGISERRAGEVIMLATGAGQESMEDPTIGNGHGLFTYFLVDGMSGNADGYEGRDGKITLVELRSYILSKVPDFAQKKYKKKQEPFICCDDNGPKLIVSKVDSAFYKKWEMGKNINGMIDNGEMGNMVRNSRGRGVALVDSNIATLYNSFVLAIKKLKLTGDSSADFFYEQMKVRYPDNILTQDAKETLAAEFINFAQRKINLFLSGRDAAGVQQMRTQLDESQRSEEIEAGINRIQYIASMDFGRLANMVQKAILLIDSSDDQLVKGLKGKYFFFKARNLFDENNHAVNVSEARNLIFQAYALDSNAAYILHTVSAIYMQMKQPDSAVVYSLKAIAKAPKWRYPYSTAAFAYQQLLRFDLAEQYFQKAIEIDTKNADAYVDFGYFKFQQNKADAAFHLYQRALEIDSSNISALNNMGWLMKDKKRYDEAISYFNTCIRKDSSFVSAYNGLARVYAALKNYDAARNYYLLSVQYYPDQAYVYDLLGNFYKEINLGDSAIHYFKLSIQTDRSYIQPYLDLAKLYERAGYADSAASFYNRIISLNPSSKSAYISLASFYQNRYKFDSAWHYFNKAIALDQNDAGTYNSIGVYFYRNSQPDSAQKYFLKAVTIDSLNTSYVTNLAAAYERKRMFDSAFYYQYKALTLSPGNAQVYNSIALLYKKRNLFDSALFNYKQALSYNNENISVLIDIADLYRDMYKTDSAVKYLNKAIDLKPDNASLYNSLGVVHMLNDQYDSAAVYFFRCLAIDSSYIRAYNNLGSMFFILEKYDQSIPYYEKALSLDSSYENPLLFMGLIYINKKEYFKAITYLSRLQQKNDKNGGSYYYLAVCYAGVNDEKLALQNLEIALKLKYPEKEDLIDQKEFSDLRKKDSFRKLVNVYFPDLKF